MEITWFGHASFGIVTSSGVRIITDPYIPEKGRLMFAPINTEADIITVSHEHWDHAAVNEVLGSPEVIKGAVQRKCGEILVEGFSTFHDAEKGRLRGLNNVFKITADNTLLVHMGDIGLIPDERLLSELHGADVIMIPVGGVFTIGPQEAYDIVRRINPRIVIPMHYAHQKCSFLRYSAEDFAHNFKGSVIRLGNHTLSIDDIPEKTISTLLIMDSAR